MATLKLWKNFSKRKNSTKQPTATADYSSSTVYLKDGTSLEQPVFVLHTDDFTYNYAQFEGMYYFVDDIVAIKNDLSEIHCSKDHLATYKSEIQASSQYVLYYTHNNTEISDARLSVKTTQTTESESGAFTNFGVGFTNVLSVIGKDHVAAFKLNLSDIKNIISQTFFDTLEQEITSVPAIDDTLSVMHTIADAGRFIVDLLKTAALSATYVGKLSECIRNCYILPMDPAAWGGSLGSVYLGKCDTGIDGYELPSTGRILHDSATVTIPWQASDWRRNAPYHEIYLYIPCIGLTTISPSDVIGAVALHVDIELDKLSGDVIVNVGTSDKVLAQYTTNVAVNYPIGSANVEPGRAVTAIGGAAAAISGSINPAIAAAMASLGLANAVQPQSMSIGSNGGGAFLGLVGYTGNKVYCFTIFHDTTVAPSSISAIKGTPYNGVMSLSGVSGYVQAAGASVPMTGFGNDKDIVNNYLNGGLYIE